MLVALVAVESHPAVRVLAVQAVPVLKMSLIRLLVLLLLLSILLLALLLLFQWSQTVLWLLVGFVEDCSLLHFLQLPPLLVDCLLSSKGHRGSQAMGCSGYRLGLVQLTLKWRCLWGAHSVVKETKL